MIALSPNTKIDFRKLLATVHGLPNSTNRFTDNRTVRTDLVAALSRHVYKVDEVLFRTNRCWAVAS